MYDCRVEKLLLVDHDMTMALMMVVMMMTTMTMIMTMRTMTMTVTMRMTTRMVMKMMSQLAWRRYHIPPPNSMAMRTERGTDIFDVDNSSKLDSHISIEISLSLPTIHQNASITESTNGQSSVTNHPLSSIVNHEIVMSPQSSVNQSSWL